MTERCQKVEDVETNLKTPSALDQDDVVVDRLAPAEMASGAEVSAKRLDDDGMPAKKRKRRRRNKRRHPYLNRDRKANVIKPEAPHNSNQFLIEDQGNTKEIDEQLRHHDVGVSRTRDSSFSVDSDADFYSSAEDEQSLWRKDFDATYENMQAERFNGMSKTELVDEFLLLEKRVDVLNKRMKMKFNDVELKSLNIEDEINIRNEFERLLKENSVLKRENMELRNKLQACNSDSKDSESDSSDSCSSCSSSSDNSKNNGSIIISPEETPPIVDYSQTNGHSPSDLQAV